MSFKRPDLPETPTATEIVVRYHMGIIGFPTAFQHDTTKSSLWHQTLFEGPFKYFDDFTRCFRNIREFKIFLEWQRKKIIVRLHISFGPIVLHV